MDKNLLENLILKLKSGNMSAVERIYGLMSKTVYLLSFSILRNSERAKDIMQETFIRVIANVNQYNAGTNVSAWICSIARNLSYKDYNKSKRTVSIELFDDNIADESSIEGWDNSILLFNALKILEVEEREVVMLYAIEQYKHREIAQILQKPTGTVQWIYSKAIKKLREQLERQGVYFVKNQMRAEQLKGGLK